MLTFPNLQGQYGSLQFQPVHHYHQTIDRDEYFALLSVADLALVTSIRDGMNTTWSVPYLYAVSRFPVDFSTAWSMLSAKPNGRTL